MSRPPLIFGGGHDHRHPAITGFILTDGLAGFRGDILVESS